MNYLYGNKWEYNSSSAILPNGINIDKFSSSAPWKLPDEWKKNKILLTVGRLSDVKNPYFIVEIMQKISPMYKLIWVGDGELKQDILKKINHYHLENKIKLVGAQHDVAPFYKCADAFVFPSKFEGFPIVLVEAQAAGCPCFVSQTITKEADCGLCEYLGISETDVDTWVKRIETFLDPEEDARGAGYNVLQSKLAIGAGQITGMGILKGNQTQLGYLYPKTTDFIFSVIGEEMGFIVAGGVIVLNIIIITKMIQVAKGIKDEAGAYLTIGIAGIFLFHTLENIGMTMGLLPITGVPLLFVSYGGSSMLTSYICLGIILNISSQRKTGIFNK